MDFRFSSTSVSIGLPANWLTTMKVLVDVPLFTVIWRSGAERNRPELAGQAVVTCVARRVVTQASDQRVVAEPAVENVVAKVAVERVGLLATRPRLWPGMFAARSIDTPMGEKL